MAEGKKRLGRALRQALDQKQDKPRFFKGLMGAYVAGVQSVGVADRPDFVWVRLRGATSEVVMAFNDSVAEVWDLPVLLIRDERFQSIWRVEGRDIQQYASWGERGAYLPPHGKTHSFASGEGVGSDPTWIFKRQYMPFLPRPQQTGSNSTIYVEQEFYYWKGQYHWWPGSGTSNLLSYRPTGAAAGRFVTVYLDGDSGNLDYLAGPEFSLIFPPTDPTTLILAPDPDEGIPICAVSLQTGTLQIGWQEIYDLRLSATSVPPTGSFIIVYDEGILLGQVSEINFMGDNVDVTGSAGGAGTYVRSGEATPLFSPTGMYWKIPEGEYATGSLAVMANGVWQVPVIHFTEQYPQSGTFQFSESPETGTMVAAIWGAPV
jgi:hypothetical protein